MFHKPLYGRVPGSGVQGCRISAGDRSCEYRYALIQNSPGAGGGLSPAALVCGDSIVVQRPFSHQRNSVHHTRVVRSSVRHGRYACTGGFLRSPGGILSGTPFVRICMRYRLSPSMVDIRLGDSAAGMCVHTKASVHRVCHSWVLDLHRSIGVCSTCCAVQSYHKGSG